MTGKIRNIVRASVPRRLISPRGLLWAAIALCVVYAICHGLGWRTHTGFLSGNAAEGKQAGTFLLLGVVYVAAYFGFVLVAPILGLASAIFALLLRFWRRDRSKGVLNGNQAGPPVV